MNPDDHPELTAYAVGELSPAEAVRVRQLLAASPEAREAYAEIQQTIGALRKQAAVPKRSLHPHQRQAVLAMAQHPVAAKPRRVNFPAPRVHKPNLIYSICKLAAAACLAVGGFILGQRNAQVPSPEVASSIPVSTSQRAKGTADADVGVKKDSPLPVTVKAEPRVEVAVAAKSAPATVPAPSTPATTGTLAAPPPSSTPVAKIAVAVPPAPAPAVAKVTAPVEAPAPVIQAPAPLRPPAFAATPVSLTAFTNASSQPDATVYFHPKLVRSVKRVFADRQITFAAPQPEFLGATKPAPSLSEAHRKTEQPPLVIHSLRAEIASCPWDSSRRLMRVIAQIPVDQPAVESNESDYKLVTKFDPFQVQGYRLVAEKHIAPSNGGNLATRFAWYEIIPTRNFAPSAEKPIALGTLEITYHKHINADSAPLRLVDRGQKWSEEREDFVFETAMVGFSLLLQGTPNIGDLNHRLVLDIAERAKGEEDRNGERTKFIRTVQQAQKAAGL